MGRRPPISTRTDTPCPSTPLFRSAGRRGVDEALTIDDGMRRLIGDNASEDALAEAAFARADRLAASARSAVAAGLTTLEEALRVTRQDDGHDDGAQHRAEGLGDAGV